MVTGYNESVKQSGKVYHVQTEDRGRKNPVIETLIYVGGRIIHRVVSSYADQNDDAKYNEKVIKILLDQQHNKIKDEIKAGAFEELRPFGEAFLTNRSFEQCILDYLAEEDDKRTLTLSLVSSSPFQAGNRARVELRTAHKTTQQPIRGASVRAVLLDSSAQRKDLEEVKSNAQGIATVDFVVPASGGTVLLSIRAEADGSQDELQVLVSRAPESA